MLVTASPTLSLQGNALVSVQPVKDELGLPNSDTTADNRLIRMVNAVSDAIEQECNRKFAAAFVAERQGFPGQPRMARIFLQRFPILNANAVESLTFDLDPGPGTVLATTDYWVEDLAAGTIFVSSRVPSTALRRPDIAQDYDPGTEEEDCEIAYAGGFVTQPQLDTAASTRWATVTAYHVGNLISPSSPANQLWMCTTPGTSGATEPTWPSSPTKATTTITDGTVVWTYQGVTGTNDGKTLPSDLENAAIDAVVSLWRRRGQDLAVTAERMGQASMTYGGGRGILPDVVKAQLLPYRVVL